MGTITAFDKAHKAMVDGTFKGYGTDFKMFEGGKAMTVEEIKAEMATMPAEATTERKVRKMEMRHTVGVNF